MSIIEDAFKQSQIASDTEQAYIAYKQTKQLALYRKLTFGLVGFVLSSLFIVAGYYSGQYSQSRSHDSATTENPRKVKQGIVFEDKPSNTKYDPNAAVNLATKDSNFQSAQPNTIVSSTEQYQWMSVQVGIDTQGRPVFTQQLVPVSAILDPGETTAKTQSISLVENTQEKIEDLSEYRILGKNLESDTNISVSKNREAQSQGQQEDLSQYRILGKPINEELSSLTETDSTPVANNSSFEAPKKLDSESENNEAAIRLKAAFDLAVAETADKDFSHKESEQETADNDSERLQIEFLPTKTQSEIGQITYQAHIYATSEHKRWIKINGIELYEGDKIKGMRLLEITPDTSVFRFQGYDFEVKAMQNWQYN